MADDAGAVADESLEFSQEISRSSKASLIPLKEDLAEWISRVLDVNIPTDKFIDSLANGVLICKLAQLIQDKSVECQRAGKAVRELPQKKIQCRENVSAESFFARDNVANFLEWCRAIGLEDTCLFETEGLVLKKDPKNVLVCIYELARVAGRYGIEPPGLVKLEKEIEKEVKNPRPKSTMTPGKSKARSTLDNEVQNVAKTCEFPLEIQRISEGRYNIGGKVIFIRMLRGCHVMVRVGGGWDTLQHFLIRHDAVKKTKVNRGSIVSVDGDTVPDEFYVIQAKYKGKGEA